MPLYQSKKLTDAWKIIQFVERLEQENFQNFCAKFLESTLSELKREGGRVNDTFYSELFHLKINSNNHMNKHGMEVYFVYYDNNRDFGVFYCANDC